MKPECPFYMTPQYYVDPKTDKGYEGSAMCKETDEYCLVEYGNECDTYNEFLKEEQDGTN